MPNLALMKISAWLKKQGHETVLIDLSSLGIEKFYASKIFPVGGTGVSIGSKLPDDIEFIEPDYDLYKTDYSMGFTSRGCIRNCGFCIVREKEGGIKEHSKPEEFVRHQNVVLMDNNFFASPKWEEKLRFFIDNEMKVNFNQGLDLRLMDEEKAVMLAKVRFYDRTFSRRCVYFAFDDPKLEPVIRKNLPMLFNHGIKPHHVMVYMLVGFNTEIDEDLRRFEILREFGVDPYVQVYNNRRDKPLVRHFARWVNKRIYKTCPSFWDYDGIPASLRAKRKQ